VHRLQKSDRTESSREKEMDKTVEHLSSYTTSLKFEDVPPDVVHQGKCLLVDTLACALGGYTSEPSKLAQGMVRTIHSTQSATILWSGGRTSVDLATFANGIMIRYLDYNDFNQSATVKDGGHPAIHLLQFYCQQSWHNGTAKQSFWEQFLPGRSWGT
jgi:2-methylcitrate dehydratase PrpD